MTTIQLEYDPRPIAKYVEKFPKTSRNILRFIAAYGRHLLRKGYLSGTELRLRVHPTDIKGRHTISGYTTKGGAIVFSSYPVNLFERGRTLRNGKREAGKFIITRKFKGALNSRLQDYADRAVRKHVGDLK